MFISRQIKKQIFLYGVFFALALAVNFWPPVSFWGAADNSQLKIYFFDVGEGDAVLARFPHNEDVLIDGGPDEKILEKLDRVLPWGDRTIETVIITHPHADHITGLLAVIKKYKIGKIYYSGVFYPSRTYISLLEEIKRKNIPLKAITSPQEAPLSEGGKLLILYPTEDLRGKEIFNLNNTSLVVKLVYHNFSCLLMGDAEEEVEETLLKNKPLVKASVIKIAHHGSSSASSQDFLQAVSPQAAIISVGKNNDYHLPSRRVLKRLERLGIKVYRTDYNGDIEVISDGEKYRTIDFP